MFFPWYRNIRPPVSQNPYVANPHPNSQPEHQIPKTKGNQEKAKSAWAVLCIPLHERKCLCDKFVHAQMSHRSLPLSKSSSASMSLLITGPAALGSSFVRRAACSWTSSSSSFRNRPWATGGAGAEVEGEAEEELPPLWARERTMSFLQIGQVRRRVVSHGVLEMSVSIVM